MSNGSKAIFLDRDGTINKDKDYLYRIEDFEYLEGAVFGLKKLCNLGYKLVVITNQSGIARGYYSEEDYLKLDKWMKKDLLNKGITIAGSYYCPHLENGIVEKYTIKCDCRKPNTALFWKAAQDLDIDMDRSFAIGDKKRDLSICKESKVKGILLSETENDSEFYKVCSNWNGVIEAIKLEEQHFS